MPPGGSLSPSPAAWPTRAARSACRLTSSSSSIVWCASSATCSAELGREPSPAEIAAEMDTSDSRVRELLKVAEQPVSLETPLGESQDAELGEFVEDMDAVQPDDRVARRLRHQQLDEVLCGLTCRERQIIELRFGLQDDRPRTLQEVSQTFGLSRERIRQIEAKTITRLRGWHEDRAPARVSGVKRRAALRPVTAGRGPRSPQGRLPRPRRSAAQAVA